MTGRERSYLKSLIVLWETPPAIPRRKHQATTRHDHPAEDEGDDGGRGHRTSRRRVRRDDPGSRTVAPKALAQRTDRRTLITRVAGVEATCRSAGSPRITASARVGYP